MDKIVASSNVSVCATILEKRIDFVQYDYAAVVVE